jgi:hypothetical protein
MKVTALRKRLYEVMDRVLETGEPAEVERKGKMLLIVRASLAQGGLARLKRLKRRKSIIGNPATLPDVKVGEWTELRNLR